MTEFISKVWTMHKCKIVATTTHNIYRIYSKRHPVPQDLILRGWLFSKNPRANIGQKEDLYLSAFSGISLALTHKHVKIFVDE